MSGDVAGRAFHSLTLTGFFHMNSTHIGCTCCTAGAPAQDAVQQRLEPANTNRSTIERPMRRWSGALAMIPQLLGWGIGFTGLFAASSICPCCGQVGCAVGIGTMGIMGGLTATVVSCLRWRWRKRNEEPKSC